ILMGLQPEIERTDVQFGDFEALKNPSYAAVLFAHGLPKPLRSIEQISELLEIPVEEVHAIVNDLFRKNLIQRDSDGSLFLSTSKHWSAEKEPPKEVIRNFHKNNLKLAIESIENMDPEKRDISSITFC